MSDVRCPNRRDRKWAGDASRRAVCLWWLMPAQALLLCAHAWGASLAVDSVDVPLGQREVAVPVHIAAGPGEEVSGVQFVLRFDGGVLVLKEAVVAEAAVKADKGIYFGERNVGEATVLIAGLNQRMIGSGPLALCLFELVDGVASGRYPVSLAEATLSDPYGSPLQATVKHGSVRVGGGAMVDEEGVPETVQPLTAPAPVPSGSIVPVRAVLPLVVAVGVLVCVLGVYFLRRRGR